MGVALHGIVANFEAADLFMSMCQGSFAAIGFPVLPYAAKRLIFLCYYRRGVGRQFCRAIQAGSMDNAFIQRG